MEAVLLAGGYGTRLRPLTYTRPKPLLPVAGRPMLEWVLDRLPSQVDKVIVAVNWQAEKLERYFAASERDTEFHVVREEEPLGTAGAVKNCEEHLGGDGFFVLNADIVGDMDLQGVLDVFGARDAAGAISLKEVPELDVVNFGVAAMDPDDPQRIRGFVEKPATPADAPSRLINAGAYLLSPSVLEMIPAGRLVSMEKEIFPQLLDAGFYGATFDGLWIDVGDPDRIRTASAALDPNTWHGRDASVAYDAYVTDSIAGDRVHIGAAAHVQRCVLGDDVTIANGARLVDCIIGDGETVAGMHHAERIWTSAVPPGYPDKQVGNQIASA